MPQLAEKNQAVLDTILTHFKLFIDSEEAKSILQRIEAEKKEVKALMDRLAKLDRKSPEFTDWVLYGLLPYSKTKHAKRVSIFPAFMNIKPFFKSHNYSDEDWQAVAGKIFNLCANFQKRPEDLNALIQTFSREPHSKNLQCGSITPILFCLNDKFPIVNNPVIHAYKSLMKLLGNKDELSQKIRDYPSNIAKLARMVEIIGYDALKDQNYLNLLCWWYEAKILRPLKEQDFGESSEEEQESGAEEEKQIQEINVGSFVQDLDLEEFAKLKAHQMKNPDTVRVRDIITKSEENKWLLPRFQRYFDWTKKDVRDFIESIVKDYYVGAILLWEMEGPPPLDVMPIKGVDRVEEARTEVVILDGQQRITSLYYAIEAPDFNLRGSSSPVYFYINLSSLLAGDDDEEVVEAHARTLSAKESYEKLLFPIYEIDSYSKWVNGLEDFLSSKSSDFNKVREIRRAVDNKLRHIWEGFEIPYIMLPSSMKIGQVTEIFERLNTRGKRLSVFDLLIARLHKYKIDLRSLWDRTVKKYPNIERYYKATEKVPIYVLQAISLFYDKNSSCKMKDVLDIYQNIYNNPAYDFQAHWEEATDYLNQAIEKLENLRDGFGVKDEKSLPFDPMIPILAALLKEIDTQHPKAECFKKLSAWYWAAVFTNAYSSAVDSQMTSDFKEMRDWFGNDAKIPRTVNQMRTEFSILGFRDVQSKSNAKYKGVMSLVALAGAKDFDTNQSLENARGNDKDHIFPKSELAFGAGKLVNSVLNITWMSKNTNRWIKQWKKPSVYVPEFIKEKYGKDEGAFIAVLATHLISKKAYDCMREDKFEEFLAERESRILEIIQQHIGIKEVQRPSLILPDQPFTNRMAFYDAIKSCDSYIYWFDKYFSQKSLEWLMDSMNFGKVTEVRIITTVDKKDRNYDNLRGAFEDFAKETKNKGINSEMRVMLDGSLKGQVHDRWILSKGDCFNLPSQETVARGQVSEIKKTQSRPPFEEWWKGSIDIVKGWGQVQQAIAKAKSNG